MSFRAIALTVVALAAGSASAQVVTIPQSALTPITQLYTTVFGPNIVTTGGGNAPNINGASGRNDDGFQALNFGFTLANFFGGSYSSFFLNNNGNISFGNGIADFTPSGPQGAAQPIISPFFADVDTRGANSGVVHYNLSTPNQAIFTWDRVGFFNSRSDLLNTFQLVVRGSDYVVPAGEGQIGFFWLGMNWETGDQSGGRNGFGGTPAAVGFGNGNSAGYVLEGSLTNGISSVVQNHSIWFNLTDQGTPTPVPPTVPAIPEPETYALMAAGLAAMGFVSRRRKQKGAAA